MTVFVAKRNRQGDWTGRLVMAIALLTLRAF